MKTTMTDLKCPACKGNTMHPEQVRNALSRYCSKYICSECGKREAMAGNFWDATKGVSLAEAVKNGDKKAARELERQANTSRTIRIM